MSRNGRIRCVEALGHAFDHFGRMGNLTNRFWGENGENPWPKHAKTRVSRCCTWGRVLGTHFQKASSRRCTLGSRRPVRNNCNVVSRSGVWGPTCRGPTHLFEHVLLLFSFILLLEHILLDRNLDFINGLELELMAFRFFRIYRKMNFCE